MEVIPARIDRVKSLLSKLQIAESNPGACTGYDQWPEPGGATVTSSDPTTGEPLANVIQCGAAACDSVAQTALEAFESWRKLSSCCCIA